MRPPAGDATLLPSTDFTGGQAVEKLADTSKGIAAKQGLAGRSDESNTSRPPDTKTPEDNPPNHNPAEHNPPNHSPANHSPANLAPPRRQTPARHAAERTLRRTPDAPLSDALTQTVAELHAALADERRAAHENRRRTTRLVSTAIFLLLLVLVLGVVQVAVSVRASRESAAAEEKTEALLRAQQAEFAALSAAVSLSAKLAALPVGTAAAPPPAVKRAPRTVHGHRANAKTRRSTANDQAQTHSTPKAAAPWRIETDSTTAPA